MIDDSNGETNFPHKLLLIQKIESFAKLLQMFYLLIKQCRKLNYLK